MELWDYLFTGDQKLDLAMPSAGKQWLASQPWGIKGDDNWWTEKASSQWRQNIHVLRSLVKGLKGRRLRRPAAIGPLSADAVLRNYVKMFRVALDRSQPHGPSEFALAACNYRGLVICPASRIGSGERIAADPVPQRHAEDDCDFFWQVVFLSLLVDGSPSFCRHCGRPLGATTRTGRPMKQTLCSRCRWTRWRAKQSKAAMRARWKLDADRRRKKLNSGE
jgi:hypothetical protein